MTWLVHLFTSLDGRISRKSWWIGSVILWAIGITGSLLLDPPALTLDAAPEFRPTLWQSLLALALIFPTLALVLKRLNDRDHPRAIGYAWAGLSLAFIPAHHLGFPRMLPDTALWEWALLALVVLFAFWIFIDNGFLKGTPGPNRHGPDPLDRSAGQPRSGAMTAMGHTRYSRGAFARDVVIGAFALVAGAYLFVPNVNFENTVNSLLRLYSGKDYEDLKTMQIVYRHQEQLDPEGERIRTERDDKMRADATAWKDYEAGRSTARNKKYAASIDHFTRAIDLYGAQEKTAGPVFLWRAWSFRKLNQFDKAIADYSAAITLQPELTDGTYARGTLYAEHKQYEKALADYDEAIRVSRIPIATYDLKRGYVLRKLGRREQALTAYGAAIERARKKYDLLATIDRGIADLTPTERETFLKSAAKKRDASTRWAEIQRGIILRDLNRFDEALAAFNEAIRLQPDGAFAYKQRGWLYEKHGRLDEALADYERASDLNDESVWLKRAVERVKSKTQ